MAPLTRFPGNEHRGRLAPENRLRRLLFGFILGIACATVAEAQMHDPARHDAAHQHGAPHETANMADNRIAVKFPKALRAHTLANMRDHLLALQEIQAALASSEFDRAAAIAEQRLGMTSLDLHGAHALARYMPDGMARIGTEMHHAASRFAVESTNVGASGDLKPALAAMASVTRQCVACHSAYRVQ